MRLPDFERDLVKRLVPWIDRADRLVRGKVDDAAAHAARSITQRLKARDDGRPTARQAAQSPSYAAAGNRLDELRAALVGPSRGSLDGLLRDAREAFFKQAFELWKPHLDPAWYRLDAEPTRAGINTVRGAVIHGYELDQEMAGVFEDAARTLKVSINLAGGQAVSAKRADDLIELWRRQAGDRIARKAAESLGSAQRTIFWAVEVALQKGAA